MGKDRFDEQASDLYWMVRDKAPPSAVAIAATASALRAAAAPPPIDREAAGRLVREVWIVWAREQPSPKASWLVPWEGLSEPEREVDRRIGETLARFGGHAPPPISAGGCSAAEPTLAQPEPVEIVFITNGEDVEVSVTRDTPLASARCLALAKSHNTGRAPEEWEIRDERGVRLDDVLTIGAVLDVAYRRDSPHTNPNVYLFLTLRVAAGGAKFTPAQSGEKGDWNG